MATKKKPAAPKAKPAPAAETTVVVAPPDSHYARLLKWCQILANAQSLKSLIEDAPKHGAMGRHEANNALECLDMVIEDIIDGIPTE